MPRKSTRRCSVKKLFQAIDKDSSGSITLPELKTAFKKAAGSDNVLSYDEMQKACRKYAGNIGRELGGKCTQNNDCQTKKCSGGVCTPNIPPYPQYI